MYRQVLSRPGSRNDGTWLFDETPSRTATNDRSRGQSQRDLGNEWPARARLNPLPAVQIDVGYQPCDCESGSVELCGRCGRRTCQEDCSWGPCQDEGVCEPTSEIGCGVCGVQRCDSSCQWEPCEDQCSDTDTDIADPVPYEDAAQTLPDTYAEERVGENPGSEPNAPNPDGAEAACGCRVQAHVLPDPTAALLLALLLWWRNCPSWYPRQLDTEVAA